MHAGSSEAVDRVPRRDKCSEGGWGLAPRMSRCPSGQPAAAMDHRLVDARGLRPSRTTFGGSATSISVHCEAKKYKFRRPTAQGSRFKFDCHNASNINSDQQTVKIMFDSIIYKNLIGPGPVIDVGAIAEGLIFYGRVDVIANTGTIKYLLGHIPPFVLLSLMRDERLVIHYLGDQAAVASVDTNDGKQLHDLICFASPQHTIEAIGYQSFKDAAGGTSQAKMGATRFQRLLRPLDHKKFDQKEVLRSIVENNIAEISISSMMQEIAPAFKMPDNAQFKLEQENQGFYINTNINLEELNKIYHQTVPVEHSTVTKAYLLSLIQDAYEATYFAAELSSEIAVNPIERSVQSSVVAGIINQHAKNKDQIERFADLTLNNCRAIREAVNTGAVSFISIVKLLNKADKFRKWLHDQPADADVLRAFYQETIKESWVDKLPTKTARWSVFTTAGFGIDAVGGGGIGTALGIGVGAIDTFILDKFLKGWKPHQFVEKDLKAMFGGKDQTS